MSLLKVLAYSDNSAVWFQMYFIVDGYELIDSMVFDLPLFTGATTVVFSPTTSWQWSKYKVSDLEVVTIMAVVTWYRLNL